MKVIIAGSRNITNYTEIEKAVTNSGFYITEVISGGARGVDELAVHWAKAWNIPNTIIKAEWDKFGNPAGPIRNQKMAEIAEALIAIWDGESKGTLNMIETASKMKLKVHIHYYNESLENFQKVLDNDKSN